MSRIELERSNQKRTGPVQESRPFQNLDRPTCCVMLALWSYNLLQLKMSVHGIHTPFDNHKILKSIWTVPLAAWCWHYGAIIYCSWKCLYMAYTHPLITIKYLSLAMMQWLQLFIDVFCNLYSIKVINHVYDGHHVQAVTCVTIINLGYSVATSSQQISRPYGPLHFEQSSKKPGFF